MSLIYRGLGWLPITALPSRNHSGFVSLSLHIRFLTVPTVFVLILPMTFDSALFYWKISDEVALQLTANTVLKDFEV